jgi:HAMP domain-containing protein
MRTIKQKSFLLFLGVYAFTGLFAYIAFQLVLGHLADDMEIRYAAKYALANKALLQEPLARELALARQLASSPVIKRWVWNEHDATLRRQALDELESFRQRLAEGSWFVALDSSHHYYFNDVSNSYAGRELVYTLSPEQSKDAWFFATMRNVKDYALNVNYDDVLDVHKVWINVLIKSPDGAPLGVAGTGLELSKFLKSFVDTSEPGIEHILLDHRLAIQAHQNRALIDHHSLTKSDTDRSTIHRIFQDPSDVDRLQDAVSRLRAGNQAETFRAKVGGKKLLVGATYIKDLDWIEITLIDSRRVLHHPFFRPLFLLSMITGLLLVFLAWAVVNSLVLKPLADVTDMAKRIPSGNYSVTPTTDRRDEIGMLEQTFSEMSSKIRLNTETLEARISKRTAELDRTNQMLQANIDELMQAHENVKTLGSMLPICCVCKKIRDDKGYWNQLEAYIRDHAGTNFSHGFCPDCQRTLYPGTKIPPAQQPSAPSE